MAGDADWVEDVKRWYFNGSRAPAKRSVSVAPSVDTDSLELGYEAAHPALQARNWPDAPTSGFADLR